MRVPVSAHTDRPWRIHEITPDFRVEDVWVYRTPGAGADDFPTMIAALRATNRPEHVDQVTRLLFSVRWRLGALLGWDRADQAVGGRIPSLRDRLPDDLRALPGVDDPRVPFTPVYELPDEKAIELANQTVHAVCHLSWVPAADGDYELHMAALVKPNGRLGRAYLAAIKPFRYLFVYPLMTRRWERAWRDREKLCRDDAAPTSTPSAAGTAWPGRRRA